MQRGTMAAVALAALLAVLAGCQNQTEESTGPAGANRTGRTGPSATAPKAGANATAPTGTTPAAPGGKRFKVVFSQCNNAEPYRAAQNALLTELCKKAGDVDLEIMDGGQDNKKQIDQIHTKILLKPDLLIVAPNERGPLTAPMKEAMDAKIPTICLERDIEKPYYTTYIRCDNKKIGQMAGEFIAQKLKAKYGEERGNIVEICGLKGVEGEINRYGGAHEVFKKYPKIKVLDEPVADWLQDKGRDRMTEMLSRFKEIDCVYGHNDPMAIGAYLAARDKNRDKEMFFVGVDGLGGSAGGVKKVMDGVLSATFVYPLCVDKALEVGLKILRDPSFKPDKTYTIDSVAITPDNAKQYYK